jgi:hypothetical protein
MLISKDSSTPPIQGEFNHKTRQERRKLLKDSKQVVRFLRNSKLTSWAPNSLIKLKRLMPMPAGCAFLGSSATTTNVWLSEYGKNQQALVANSGSDISLIYQKALGAWCHGKPS